MRTPRPLLTAAVVVIAAATTACTPSADGSLDDGVRVTGGAAATSGTSGPVWPAPQDVEARVEAAGLDLGPMGVAEHYHPQLLVMVDGSVVGVPAGIGVDPVTGAMSALHTHTSDGILHVEADEVGEVFTLGQLFVQWGVDLDGARIGGALSADGTAVRVVVDGAPVDVDPADVVLSPDQQIVLSVET